MKTNTAHQKGFIAILTNPMLKENWTKIVVCRTDAEVKNACRSLELPCKFEVAEKIPISGDADKIFKTFCTWAKMQRKGQSSFFSLNPHAAGEAVKKAADKPTRRSNFKFTMVGIKAGEELVFIPSGLKVRVAIATENEAKIEHHGKTYKLSEFAAKYMPSDKQTASASFRGPELFSYRGEKLTDLRDRIEFGE